MPELQTGVDYPDPGTLPARLAELDERIDRAENLAFTAAELRILAFLPTHLSVREIAERLHVSRATVKTHVSSIYGKGGSDEIGCRRTDGAARPPFTGAPPAQTAIRAVHERVKRGLVELTVAPRPRAAGPR